MSQPTGQTSTTDTSTDATKSTSAGSTQDGANQDGTDQKHDDKVDEALGLKSALKKERDRANALEKQIKDAELQKLPELERFRSENAALLNENEKLKTENTKMQIGMELGLKWNVAKRISGDDEDSMRKDAAELLKSLRNEDDEEKDRQKNKDKDAVNKAKNNDGHASGFAGKPNINDLLRAAAGRTPH